MKYANFSVRFFVIKQKITIFASEMELKTRAIVLRTVKYGENKLIIDFLTRDVGRESSVWKFSGERRIKVARQLFQPLAILDIVVVNSSQGQLSRIKEARLAHVYTSLPFDGIKLSLAFFVAEFLTYATRDLHNDKPLYDFVEQSLLWLDASERGVANFHLMFMMRMSRFLGFFPDMSSHRKGYIFDLREGRFCGEMPAHGDILMPDDAEKMHILMRMTPSNLHFFKMTQKERNQVVDFSLRFYRLHIPLFGEMKSLSVLRTL
jgi:DNA repair protein RecO (recombination protein O)